MHKVKKLTNGLTLVTVPVPGTKTATILVMVATGSKYETRKNNGISHFLEHMFFKGTFKRPTAMAISAELDGVGGEYNAFTGKEYTGYYAKVDASKLDVAMDVVSDMLLNSKFEAEEIEKEKGVIIEEINVYEDNPMMHIEDVFEQCLYGDQPAGWETAGTKENIRRFTRRDFTDYFNSQYGTRNAVVCVAGKVDARTDKLAEKHFSGFRKNKAKDKSPVIEKQKKPGILLNSKKTDQAHISLGVRSFPLGHKDEYVLKALAVLLGGSMSSRLFTSVREQKGLAYYIRTGTEAYTDCGYLTTEAGVRIDKIEEAITTIIEEYARIKTGEAGEAELKKVKDLIRGKMAIQLESSDTNANWFAKQVLMRKKIITAEEYLEKIDKVTAKDLTRVAKDIFADKGLNLAVIGPYEDKGRFKALLRF